MTAPLMSVLTFLTAPWSVGAIHRTIRGREPLWHTGIALVLWLLSTSWLYDLYLLLRDGEYPVTWLANLFASSLLYLSAGLFWSLEWRANRGVTFAFLELEWFPSGASRDFAKIRWQALVFIVLGAAMLLPYLWWAHQGV